MIGQVQRVLPALLLALVLHGVLLSLQLRENRSRPAAKSLQRITVSLGTRESVITKSPVEKKQLPPLKEKQEVKSSKPVAGEDNASVVPAATPHPVHVPKPARRKIVSRQRKAKPQATVSFPAEQKRNQQSAPFPAQEKEHGDPQPSSAAVLLQATPLYQVNPPPEYPRLARRRGLEGIVILEVLVDSTGKVANIRISASSGHRLLDQAAVKGVQGWRFTPGTISGRPQGMWVEIPLRFQLR